jgi:hypothetical protein
LSDRILTAEKTVAPLLRWRSVGLHLMQSRSGGLKGVTGFTVSA